MMGPEEIERASMAVIGREMGAWAGPAENLPVLKRVIHTTADFDFVRNLLFSPNAVWLGREALRRGVTRAVVSMERAAAETPDAIFAIGNAPTALIRLCELVREGAARPSLVVGVPVGFVNVVESKEMLVATDVPYIAAMGRKGGSPVASAVVNALLYGMEP